MFITIKMLLKMESQNNIFDQFKSAAEQEEEVHMPFKEPLWERIEARLDEEPEQRRVFVPWIKYLAASVVLLLGIGIVWKVNRTDDTKTTEHATATVNTAPTTLPVEQTQNKVVTATPETVNAQKHASSDKSPRNVAYIATQHPISRPSRIITGIDTTHIKATIADNHAEKSFVFRSVIKDLNGEGYPGAVVRIRGTNINTVTDENGNFEIKVPDSNAVLIANFLGTEEIYKLRNIPVSGMVMKESHELTGVAVYANKIDKRTYTGSLSTIKAEDVAKRPVTNVAKALSGAAPGVMVTTGSGQPGSTPDIMLRGQGSLSAGSKPLIVLDGSPYTGELTNINPLDVAKMTVLKDKTATALFGSRAANGVVLITTRQYEQKKRNWMQRVFNLKSRHQRSQLRRKRQEERKERKEDKEIKAEVNIEESYAILEENKFESPVNAPQSTFSIDVDKASYSNIRRFILSGTEVPKDAVRIEEMVNYFTYQYPQPKAGQPFSINTESSPAPWNPRHRLLKIGLQGKTIPQAELPASNLVFLIDVSGSMDEANKLPYVQQSMELLTRQLRAQDHVAIVVYAGAAGLALPSTSGAQKDVIRKAIKNLKAGGSTAGGAGIELAYKVAKEHFIPDGNNRIILATDGDFNVGASSDRSMQELIEEKRKDNIFLTCLGFGMGNYKDSKMEILADKGNGNYAYIDNFAEAKKVLEKEFGGTMYTIAKDVKIQIEFNPSQVQSYRLIGYENRKLNAEDFANDAVDAGELGSGHTVTVLYEIIPKGVESNYAVEGVDRRYVTVEGDPALKRSTELAQIKFRYKEPDGEKSKLITQNIHNTPVPLSQASKDFKLAASVAWFGLQLRDSKLIPDKSLHHIAQFAREAIDKKNAEEAELLKLIEAAQ